MSGDTWALQPIVLRLTAVSRPVGTPVRHAGDPTLRCSGSVRHGEGSTGFRPCCCSRHSQERRGRYNAGTDCDTHHRGQFSFRMMDLEVKHPSSIDPQMTCAAESASGNGGRRFHGACRDARLSLAGATSPRKGVGHETRKTPRNRIIFVDTARDSMWIQYGKFTRGCRPNVIHVQGRPHTEVDCSELSVPHRRSEEGPMD